MAVYKAILDGLEEKGALHFTLIDPDEIGYENAAKFSAESERAGTDAILIGGTVGVQGELLDETVKMIKECWRCKTLAGS